MGEEERVVRRDKGGRKGERKGGRKKEREKF